MSAPIRRLGVLIDRWPRARFQTVLHGKHWAIAVVWMPRRHRAEPSRNLAPADPELPECLGGMTPEKLRKAADWFDTYDKLAEAHWWLLEQTGLHQSDELAEVRAVSSSKEVQSELRAWADALARHGRLGPAT